MTGVLQRLWLPRSLFWLTVLAATLLLALFLLAPLVDDGGTPTSGWRRVLALFARDLLVRRTALATAAGLYVTALVFFWPATKAAVQEKEAPPPPVPVPGHRSGSC
jgi:hypothetical protein